MIITKLKGGLGNQMFQYATAKGLSSSNKLVYLDTSYFTDKAILAKIQTPRKFELQLFRNIKAKNLNCLQEYSLNKKYFKAKVLKKILFPNLTTIQQIENEFIDDLNNNKGNLYLDGYFQSEKYFTKVRNELLFEFTFDKLDKNNSDMLDKINSYQNSVCVHVRRGDYLKPEIQRYHGLLPITYYFNAVNLVQEKVNYPHFFVFSDDSDWCKDNLRFPRESYTLVNGNRDDDSWKDMCLMTYCKHHIIANSSFSWWGAWLSTKGGLKMAPKNWFNPEEANFNISDFIPETWQIIDYD